MQDKGACEVNGPSGSYDRLLPRRNWGEWLGQVTTVERSDQADPRPVTILCWIGGRMAQVEESLDATFKALLELRELADLAFLFDGPEVTRWAVVENYHPHFPSWTDIILPSSLDLPAVLFTEGLFRARSPWLAFAWPGVQPTRTGLEALLAEAGESLLVHGALPACELAQPELRLDSWRLVRRNDYAYPPEFQDAPMPHGWLQMISGVPMANCLLASRAQEEIGGFDPRALLQTEFWWDYVRRLSRYCQVSLTRTASPQVRWAWVDYPFVNRVGADPDLAARLMSDEKRRYWDLAAQAEVPPADIAHLSVDLPPADAERLTSRMARWVQQHDLLGAPTHGADEPLLEAPGQWPLKIAVLGGVYEPPHNQIYFYSFLERLVGKGYATWRPILDRYALPVDLEANDLVVFSRPRANESRTGLDYCAKAGIATIAMFDDNWLMVAKEWPEYRQLFTPGQPDYENFLHACRTADLCVFYNQWLAKDFAPHCRHQICLSPTVDVDAFRIDEPEWREPGRLLVGYAGSPRQDTPAFRAMCQFVTDRPEATAFVMAHALPEELKSLPPERVRFVRYEFNYHQYARILGGVRPDILLAPLGASHTERCKCPTKYLDASSAGSACIYSDTDAYRPYIRHGENGLIAANNLSDWYEAIRRLAEDAGLRQRIARAAEADVRARFSTEVLMPEFLGLLKRAVSLARETRP